MIGALTVKNTDGAEVRIDAQVWSRHFAIVKKFLHEEEEAKLQSKASLEAMQAATGIKSSDLKAYIKSKIAEEAKAKKLVNKSKLFVELDEAGL